jgi:hypothetical protein
MNHNEFYKTYLADDNVSALSVELLRQVILMAPVHVLDYGSGTGKHANILNDAGICTIAYDISFLNVIKGKSKYELPCSILADESYLRHLCNVDCVMTTSVLDHIKDVSGIINEFKRIANKAVFLAETNDEVGQYYFAHDYESYGFKKLDFEYTGEDGAKYFIWVWKKENILNEKSFSSRQSYGR